MKDDKEMSGHDEFEAEKLLWDNLGKMRVPDPSEEMRTNFYNMLDEFKAKEQTKSRFSWDNLVDRFRGWVIPQWTVQLGFSLLLVGLGWVIGYKTGPRAGNDQTASQQKIETLAAEVQDMKSAMMLSLIENPSATERLRAVSYTSEITQADEQVINALLATLNNDPNVNVRLATLEALTQYADAPTVREQLVKAIALQDSPMVQVALADMMVKLQEKSSVKVLQKMLRKDDLNDQVKLKIQETIRDLT